MCGLGISGCNDSVLGDSVQSGVVTEEKIDGATGGLPSPAAQRAGRAEQWRSKSSPIKARACKQMTPHAGSALLSPA